MGKYVPPHLRRQQQEQQQQQQGDAAESVPEPAKTTVTQTVSLRPGTSLSNAVAPASSPSAFAAASSSRFGGRDYQQRGSYSAQPSSRFASLAEPSRNERDRSNSDVARGYDDAPKPNASSRWNVDLDSGSNYGRSARWDDNHGYGSQNRYSSRNRQYDSHRVTKIQFFGDSFIRLFSAVKNHQVHVEAFKGGSAKGVGREGNENRLKIEQMVRRKRPERLVFCFGSVDVHLSYYYSKVIKEQELDIEEIANSYIDFVATLTDTVPADKITVVGIYPSPLEDHDVRKSLSNYGSVPQEQTHLVPDEDIANDERQERVRTYNRYLEARCRMHGIQFASAFDEMIDPATNKMKEIYRDVSDTNIHVVWETTIYIWLNRWPWYREMAQPGLDDELQKTLDEYLKTKPWAERTHLAATIGVQRALLQGQSESD